MNRYISVVGLYVRSNLYRILLITLVTALLAGFLVYRYPMEQEVTGYYYDPNGAPVPYAYSAPYLDGVIRLSRAPIVCAVGFTAVVAVMSLTGCGYGAKTDYTVRRLRVREKTACLLWSGYHAALLLIFWAALALTLYGALLLRGRMIPPDSGYTFSPQSMMLVCYTDTFLHHLIPMRDLGVWAVDVASVLAAALSTVQFSHRQRRGGFSIGIFCVAACVIAAFFCPLGGSWSFILMVLLLALAGGVLNVMVGGDGDAA